MHYLLVYLYSTKIHIFGIYGGSAFLLVIFLHLFWKRTFGKVGVNCWFCNTDAVVVYKQKNNWTCKQCYQYNGFDKHGDYNKTLPEMYDERLNISRISHRITDKVENELPQRVRLCEKCSRYQTLKCKQLAQFKPLVEENFATEVDVYKCKLEKLYQVCRECMEASQRYIKLQDTILRGRMMPQIKKLDKHKLPVICDIPNIVSAAPTESKCMKTYEVLLQFVMFTLASIYFVLALHHFLPHYLKLNISYFNFYGLNVLANLPTFIITNGLSLSVVLSCVKGIPKIRSARFYAVFWFVCGILMITTQNRSFDKHVLDLMNFYSSLASFENVIAKKENDSSTIGFSSWICTLLHFVLCTIMFIVCLINVVFSVLAPAFTVTKTIERNDQSVAECLENKATESTPMADVTGSRVDDDFFSDDDVSLDDPQTKEIDGNSDVADHSLNGSLNALKLQDSDQFLINKFKNPNNIFSGGSLPSSLHTPPPSRSSSLLSLASHNSGLAIPNVKPQSTFSSVNFARPSTELPFQRYKANSTVGCWTHSAAYSRSLTSSFKPRLPRSNRGSLVSELHKPLLSPAKLPWLTKGQNHAASISRSANLAKKKNFIKAESEGDVSVFDSISQAGDRIYPELSDNDDEVSCTPDHCRKAPSLNSSSPKSTISSITSITMKSVEEVEKSRVCKWILAGCLLVNLVLVVLLILEVKEMREMEHWKSKVSL